MVIVATGEAYKRIVNPDSDKTAPGLGMSSSSGEL